MAFVSPGADAFGAVAGFSIAAWLLRGRQDFVSTMQQLIYRSVFDRSPTAGTTRFWASVLFWYVCLFFVLVGIAGTVFTIITLVS